MRRAPYVCGADPEYRRSGVPPRGRSRTPPKIAGRGAIAPRLFIRTRIRSASQSGGLNRVFSVLRSGTQVENCVYLLGAGRVANCKESAKPPLRPADPAEDVGLRRPPTWLHQRATEDDCGSLRNASAERRTLFAIFQKSEYATGARISEAASRSRHSNSRSSGSRPGPVASAHAVASGAQPKIEGLDTGSRTLPRRRL